MQAFSPTELIFYLFTGALFGYFVRILVGGALLGIALYFVVGHLLEQLGWHSLQVNWPAIADFLTETFNYILMHANRLEVLIFFPAFYFGYRRGILSNRHKNGNGYGNGNGNGNGHHNGYPL